MLYLSLRARVLVVCSFVLLAAMLIGGALLISNARDAVHAEIAASRELAVRAIGALVRAGAADTILSDLSVRLRHPRHVRIEILHARGEPVLALRPREGEKKTPGEPAPSWFDLLIRPSADVIRVPVAVDGAIIGYVVITGEPSDEIVEVWRDFRLLLYLNLATYAVLLVAIHRALGIALQPLAAVSHGLEQLQSGDYGARLPVLPVADLTQIGVRFNALATRLETTIQENVALSQQLVSIQDTERKNIAHELHDEFGPCLFGINVDATFIETEAGKLEGAAGTALAERARAILAIVDRMQQQNRDLLHRLRPMALGHVGLPRLLEDLVDGFRQRDSDVRWRLTVPEHLESYGETVDLTIYRMVQECLTNAARHADASEIDIALRTVSSLGQLGGAEGGWAIRSLQVEVSDNGRGFDPQTRPGYGLAGMTQRVKALGGEFSVRPREGGGTVVSILIPV